MSNKSDNGWIGVDLDRTLAYYDYWRGPEHVGAPIPAMVERVKQWLAEGQEVRIFTARVSHDNTALRMVQAQIAAASIRDWCVKHLGIELPITCVKDFRMYQLWDDRCVSVVPNTGESAND